MGLLFKEIWKPIIGSFYFDATTASLSAFLFIVLMFAMGNDPFGSMRMISDSKVAPVAATLHKARGQ